MIHIIEDKMLGCLYVQAIGDTLGLRSESMNKNEVSKNYPASLSRYDQIVLDTHRMRCEKGA